MAARRRARTGRGPRPDFADRALGERAKAIPYGIYDLVNDDGWVSVGDTAEFAVEAIRRWQHQTGRLRFPDADRLLITGGSNGYRLRAWKVELARPAAETGLRITACHYPPGTSKMEPDRASQVQLHHHQLATPAPHQPANHHRPDLGTSTTTGLTIQAAHDPTCYTKGIRITDIQLKALPLRPHDWHGECNHTLDVQSELA